MAAPEGLDRYTGGNYQSLQAESKNFFLIFLS